MCPVLAHTPLLLIVLTAASMQGTPETSPAPLERHPPLRCQLPAVAPDLSAHRWRQILYRQPPAADTHEASSCYFAR